MSLEQAQAFAKGLDELVTNFKAEEAALAEEFKTYVQGAGSEFQEKSHTYAKESVEKVDQLATDIQSLYQETYGEELPPPTGGAPEEPIYPDNTLPGEAPNQELPKPQGKKK
jgi:hypothetical protein